MRAITALLMTMAVSSSALAAPACKELDQKASDIGLHIPGHMAIHRVIGSGRLQFYSAPNPSCKMPGVFILPGEQVLAYVTFGDFTAIMHIHPKTNEDTQGWVFTARLKETGYGIAPRQ